MNLFRRYQLRVIVLFAVVFRIIALANYVQLRPRQALGAIPFLFEPGNIAFSIASGNGFASPFRVPTGPTAWMTPVYPGLLAGFFKVFGIYSYDAFLAAALFNIACSTLTCIPLFYVARRLKMPCVPALAALLWAIFPNAIVIPYEAMWDASLAALLATTILWATLKLAEQAGWRNFCAYGLLWGFTLMSSAALGILLPFLLFWRTALKPAILMVTIAAVCCVPWTVRNYQVFHSLVPLRSVMGLSLWLGNNDQADGTSTSGRHPIDNSREREQYIEEGEIAYNQRKQTEALAWIGNHPGRTVILSTRRFIAIWAGGSVEPLNEFARSKSRWLRWVLGFNLFAAVGTVAGVVVLYRRRSLYVFPLAVYPVVFPLTYYVTLAPARYRHPIDPVILLLTAVAVKAVFHKGLKDTQEHDQIGLLTRSEVQL